SPRPSPPVEEREENAVAYDAVRPLTPALSPSNGGRGSTARRSLMISRSGAHGVTHLDGITNRPSMKPTHTNADGPPPPGPLLTPALSAGGGEGGKRRGVRHGAASHPSPLSIEWREGEHRSPKLDDIQMRRARSDALGRYHQSPIHEAKAHQGKRTSSPRPSP